MTERQRYDHGEDLARLRKEFRYWGILVDHTGAWRAVRSGYPALTATTVEQLREQLRTVRPTRSVSSGDLQTAPWPNPARGAGHGAPDGRGPGGEAA